MECTVCKETKTVEILSESIQYSRGQVPTGTV